MVITLVIKWLFCQCRPREVGGAWSPPPPPPPPHPEEAVRALKTFPRIIWYCEYIRYNNMHNNTWITKLITDYLSAERKGGRGVTFVAVSVARACKWWDFKSPVVWSRRIKHFCALIPVPNQTLKFGCVCEGHLSQVPRLWGWNVWPPPPPPPNLPFRFCFHCKYHVVQ